ncbi:MAG: hypothetical protein R3B71_02195 [Candidatus Gracilibacteria bacterium]
MRLLTYLKVIRRAYKKSSRSEKIKDVTEHLEGFVKDMFRGYNYVRGSHVHQLRYSDPDLDRLSLFDTLTNSENEDFVHLMEFGYKLAFRDIRKKWKKRIEKDSMDLLKGLDIYFDSLYKLLTKKGEFIFPSL